MWMERNKIFVQRQKRLEKVWINNETIALNILFSPNDKEGTKQAYISKHNPVRESKVILLMITY